MYKMIMAHHSSCLQTFKASFFIWNTENHSCCGKWHHKWHFSFTWGRTFRTPCESPAKKKRKDANENSKKNIDVDVSVGHLLHRSNTTSNDRKSTVLSGLKQDLQKDKTGPKFDAELASIIEETLQDKMNKYHHPENCKSLKYAKIRQWDNLSPSVHSNAKLQTSIQRNVCPDWHDQ